MVVLSCLSLCLHLPLSLSCVATVDPSDIELVVCPSYELETCPPSPVSICFVPLFVVIGGHILLSTGSIVVLSLVDLYTRLNFVRIVVFGEGCTCSSLVFLGVDAGVSCGVHLPYNIFDTMDFLTQ